MAALGGLCWRGSLHRQFYASKLCDLPVLRTFGGGCSTSDSEEDSGSRRGARLWRRLEGLDLLSRLVPPGLSKSESRRNFWEAEEDAEPVEPL